MTTSLTRAVSLAAALAIAPLSLAGTAALAAPWTLDKSHAAITFSIDHFGFSETHGSFREFDADVTFDPEDITATSARFTIDAASFDTNMPARDDHVRSADFLDVANHPEIVFVTTAVTQTGDNTATVAGDLTIKGTTQPVTFDAVLNKVGPSPITQKETAGITAVGTIDRTAFGVDTYAPAIGAEIAVTISLEMTAE